jgi:hypothetical protein
MTVVLYLYGAKETNMTDMTENRGLVLRVNVTEKTLQSLLVGALEGGSNYWYYVVDTKFPQGITYEDFRHPNGKFNNDPEDYWHPLQVIPFIEGCSVIFIDIEDSDIDPDDDEAVANVKKYTLDRAACLRGIEVMAEKYPHHFADVVAENDDADTADVYLQCCLFGECVYG